MERRTSRIAVLALTAALVVGVASEARGATVWWKTDTIGDWTTEANWSPDWSAVPVVNQLPASGDWARMGAGTSEITVTSNLDIGGGYFWSSGGYNSLVMDGTAAPSWNSGSIYLSTPEDAEKPGFTLEDGTLNIVGGRSLIIAWNNTSNALGHFVQKAGTVTIGGNLDMCVKSSTQIAKYDLEGGDFTVNRIRLGAGGNHQQSVFTQSAGTTATVNTDINLGSRAGDGTNPDSKAVYNLDGGELTVKGATPFVFTQLGAPVYVDFDGGAMNLLGTWDFDTLTGIEQSDFRALGEPATAEDLAFEEVTLFDSTYTRITLAEADPTLPGDANDSGFVDDDDLAVLLSNWEADPGTITTWQLGDFTADTDVDDDDLAVLLGNWTGPPPGGAAVPEPATLALLGLGGLSVLRRRRK